MIPVTTLNFTIITEGNFDFGRAPGSSLRGALYAALATMYDTQQDNRNRGDMDSNPVGWLLRLEDGSVSGGHNVARPIAIRPPLVTDEPEISFGLSFYGQAIQTIPMVISAIPLMGKMGVGRRRSAFELRRIDYVDPITGQHSRIMDEHSHTTFDIPQAPSHDVYKRISTMINPMGLIVTFLTPTRIIAKGALVHKPIFHIWFQRLLERIRTLSVVYTDEDIRLPFGDLLDAAKPIEIVSDETCWFEAWSGSRRDGRMKPLGGFVGKVQYRGDFSTMLPYILLGQTLQVGKNTVKGCGWYDIQYQWQS